jgi:hypothetical protein
MPDNDEIVRQQQVVLLGVLLFIYTEALSLGVLGGLFP